MPGLGLPLLSGASSLSCVSVWAPCQLSLPTVSTGKAGAAELLGTMRAAIKVVERVVMSTDVWDKNRLCIVELACRIGVRKVIVVLRSSLCSCHGADPLPAAFRPLLSLWLVFLRLFVPGFRGAGHGEGRASPACHPQLLGHWAAL